MPHSQCCPGGLGPFFTDQTNFTARFQSWVDQILAQDQTTCDWLSNKLSGPSWAEIWSWSKSRCVFWPCFFSWRTSLSLTVLTLLTVTLYHNKCRKYGEVDTFARLLNSTSFSVFSFGLHPVLAPVHVEKKAQKQAVVPPPVLALLQDPSKGGQLEHIDLPQLYYTQERKSTRDSGRWKRPQDKERQERDKGKRECTEAHHLKTSITRCA